MKTSSIGIGLIRHFEGCELKAYQDSVGVWTIGYGHTLGVHRGMVCTQNEADEWLIDDLGKVECEIPRDAPWVNQTQFDALASFGFNLGEGALRVMLSHGRSEVPQQMLRWDHAGGKVVAGLTKRRRAERAMYLGIDWRTA